MGHNEIYVNGGGSFLILGINLTNKIKHIIQLDEHFILETRTLAIKIVFFSSKTKKTTLE